MAPTLGVILKFNFYSELSNKEFERLQLSGENSLKSHDFRET